MKIETDDDRMILIAAFRYALGQCNYMPSVVAGAITQCWPDLTKYNQRLIKREIAEAIERGHAGTSRNVATWRRVLAIGDKNAENGVESKNGGGA